MKTEQTLKSTLPADFDYQAYRDAFLGILQGIIHHNGMSIAEDGHFRAVITNAQGLALVAERALSATKAAAK